MNKLTNSFHNTTCKTKLTDEQLTELEGRLMTGRADAADKATARRIREKLCGLADCKCGDTFGRRG